MADEDTNRGSKAFLSDLFRADGARRAAMGACLALIGGPSVGHAASIQTLFRFAFSHTSPSHYADGASPSAELLQASDGNFYGTTIVGGAGLCSYEGRNGYSGCGTIFRMTPQHVVTVLYSFPYETGNGVAPDGAFPAAGLIQGKDGFLYGVASDGGRRTDSCKGVYGCGTLFRISTAGAFTLLHQFCSGEGCANPTEGARPLAHLVQIPSGLLCGTTLAGGNQNSGTVFCATTAGSVSTEYVFDPTNGTDGIGPVAALLVGLNGKTLFGTTFSGGTNGVGTVFAYQGGKMTVLHDFDSSASSSYEPQSALIFGEDRKLYGTTFTGGTAGGIFSLATDGSAFVSTSVFNSNVASEGYAPTSGLVLARNGLMYGTTSAGGTGAEGIGGTVYSFDPVSRTAINPLASFAIKTGIAPHGALIEGKDRYLYGTTTEYGNPGRDSGTLYRVTPALPAN